MSKEEKADHLALSGNRSVQTMLTKTGKNTPSPEVVCFSDFVVKINRKGKDQTRVMLITNKAIYNLLPSNYATCKRRIALDLVAGVTASQTSDEFVLHVPDEYDYRFKSAKKEKICEMLSQLYKRYLEKEKKDGKRPKLTVLYVQESDLEDKTTTKTKAKNTSKEDRQKRWKELAGVLNGQESGNQSDDDEKKAATRNEEFTQVGSHRKATIQEFDLLKVLGRGSFGKVMQVRHKQDGKVYAMKILKKKAIIARNQVEHTNAERRILESLTHPFLMTLRFAFQSKDKLYFVLDYFQGGELFFHLKNNRRFPEEVARVYVAEIAAALGHLHSLNVVYRDLKPENILLDDQGHVCLTDFGLSKDLDAGEKAHTFCGTPEYLAPEIVTGAGHDKAVDWWSLGILLYELTVGIPPFYSQNVNEMYNKIQHGVLRFPPFLTENCKSLIFALLNRDPKKRCGSTNDVEDLKAHPFFKELDWNAMLRKEIDVPYKPKVKGPTDVSQFDSQFTSEPVVDSVAPSSTLSQTLNEMPDAFAGFTFNQSSEHLG